MFAAIEITEIMIRVSNFGGSDEFIYITFDSGDLLTPNLPQPPSLPIELLTNFWRLSCQVGLQ